MCIRDRSGLTAQRNSQSTSGTSSSVSSIPVGRASEFRSVSSGPESQVNAQSGRTAQRSQSFSGTSGAPSTSSIPTGKASEFRSTNGGFTNPSQTQQARNPGINTRIGGRNANPANRMGARPDFNLNRQPPIVSGNPAPVTPIGSNPPSSRPEIPGKFVPPQGGQTPPATPGTFVPPNMGQPPAGRSAQQAFGPRNL